MFEMKVKIGKKSYTPKDFRDYSVSSLLKVVERINPELAEAYIGYTEGENFSKLCSIIYKPFRGLEPRKALLKSMVHALQANGRKITFLKEAAKRYEFMLFKYSPEIFNGNEEFYFVEILRNAEEMKKAAKECGSCIKNGPLDFFEKWALDPGTVFGSVLDEEGNLQGYFRAYFYEDCKGNLIAGIDTVEPNKVLFFETGKWKNGTKLLGFSAIAALLPHCDYVLSDPKMKCYLKPPSKYHTGKMKKLGTSIENLYSHAKHYQYKRRKAPAVNCFSEYFISRIF